MLYVYIDAANGWLAGWRLQIATNLFDYGKSFFVAQSKNQREKKQLVEWQKRREYMWKKTKPNQTTKAQQA